MVIAFFMMYWREILSGFAVSIALYAYFNYFKSILAGKTEPHLFSWGIWVLTTGIAFFAQVSGCGGWGTAQNGLTFLVSIFIAFLALKYGQKGKFHTLDWWSLFLSFLAILKLCDHHKFRTYRSASLS